MASNQTAHKDPTNTVGLQYKHSLNKSFTFLSVLFCQDPTSDTSYFTLDKAASIVLKSSTKQVPILLKYQNMTFSAW